MSAARHHTTSRIYGTKRYQYAPSIYDNPRVHNRNLVTLASQRISESANQRVDESASGALPSGHPRVYNGNAMTELSSRFEEALILATRLHAGQRRKGKYVPYIAHLLAVTSLVLEHGGGEEEAIAALLHDAIEDQGHRVSLEEIHQRFGEVVANIVKGCSDATGLPKPPWRERKEAYIAHLREASASERLVSAADKLHNARCIRADYRALGEELWERFNGGREGTLWYYRTLVETFQAAGPTPLVEELAQVVAEIERLAAAGEETG
jgi:hypothetical protein